jgi:hypothetical protein
MGTTKVAAVAAASKDNEKKSILSSETVCMDTDGGEQPDVNTDAPQTKPVESTKKKALCLSGEATAAMAAVEVGEPTIAATAEVNSSTEGSSGAATEGKQVTAVPEEKVRTATPAAGATGAAVPADGKAAVVKMAEETSAKKSPQSASLVSEVAAAKDEAVKAAALAAEKGTAKDEVVVTVAAEESTGKDGVPATTAVAEKNVVTEKAAAVSEQRKNVTEGAAGDADIVDGKGVVAAKGVVEVEAGKPKETVVAVGPMASAAKLESRRKHKEKPKGKSAADLVFHPNEMAVFVEPHAALEQRLEKVRIFSFYVSLSSMYN